MARCGSFYRLGEENRQAIMKAVDKALALVTKYGFKPFTPDYDRAIQVIVTEQSLTDPVFH